MKKVFIVLITVVMMLSLFACSNATNDNNGKKESEQNKQSNTQNSNNDNSNNNEDKREDLSLKVSKDEKKTIVISALSNTPFLKLAKEKYEKLHPNITIQIKGSVSDEKSTVSLLEMEQYVTKTTTEILSGNGGDLFVLGEEIPVDQFIRKNAFVDLNQYLAVDTSFDTNQYYMNVIENQKISGSLYVLSTRFELDSLLADKDAISQSGIEINDQQNWTWSKFIDVSKQLVNKGIYTTALPATRDGILNRLVFENKNYSQLVDMGKKESHFDSSLFTGILEQVKKLFDDKVFTADPPQGGSYFQLSQILSAKHFIMGSSMLYKNPTVYQVPHYSEKESGVSFTGLDQYAMNANSSVKMEAWDFLKFLMSYDMQLHSPFGNDTGFPVNKAANEKAFNDFKDGTKMNNLEGGEATVSQASFESVKKLINEASIRKRGNDKIETIITEESKSYFSGQKSAESVAKIIQNRVMTYLNE